MATDKLEIQVYADWQGLNGPTVMGMLSVRQGKGKKLFSFEFDEDWLSTQKPFFIDPDLFWNKGRQFPGNKTIFGIFNDSMPDTWGKTLMKRIEIQKAKEEERSPRNLHELDFLLGVNDQSRMGALRFKIFREDNFEKLDLSQSIPPWTSVRELQFASSLIESEKDSKELRKWLKVLLAPGSSLGGARPKANVLDEKGNLWIAKFPSKGDTTDKAAWEFVTYKLALKAGVEMSESKLEKIKGAKYHTFFTKRFDRKFSQRIHFSSAMTLTGNTEETIKDNTASYLDLAELIQFNSDQNKKELHQLWTRIVFTIAVSNTDDHLRNHGFLLLNNSWKLSPAFDINPSVEKEGLSLNIDMHNNALDFDLAESVGIYFQLKPKEMKGILSQVKKSVSTWREEAKKNGISSTEIELMSTAFRL